MRSPISLALYIVLIGFLVVGGGGYLLAHALTGAIWTSEEIGEQIDGNIYDDKNDVYLNGGPVKEGAAGLPPSDPLDPSTFYVFQVTNPSGSVLLSQDKAKCRVFTVGVDGRVNMVIPSTMFGNGGDCSHDFGVDVDTAALTIQLMPYANTPNNGGEYKAWTTRVDDFAAACGTGIDAALNLSPNGPKGLSTCGGSYGFVGGHIKTDNYKVRAGGKLGSVAGLKYYDGNANGTLDVGELGIPGWPIKICRITSEKGTQGVIPVGQCAETLTSALGSFGFVGLGGGTYRLREARARDVHTDGAPFDVFDWEQTEPVDPATTTIYATGSIDIGGAFDSDAMNGVYEVTVSGDDAVGLHFGNVARALEPVGGGLTWGYWKTHTGTGDTPPGAPRDPVYLMVPMGIDLGLSVGTHLDVDSAENADTVFAVDGSGAFDEPPWPSPQEISDLCSAGDCRSGDFSHPADCDGDCHEQLVVQFLALELNLKSGQFSGDAIYINPGDPNSGKTVNEIVAEADAALSAWFDGGSFDFHALQATVNAMNENASSGVLFSLVILPGPPAPLCFVGFACVI